MSLPAAGSAYQLLQTAGKSDAGFNYRRFHRAIDRLYGVMYEAYYAIYHPVTKERILRFRFKFIEDDTLGPRRGGAAARATPHQRCLLHARAAGLPEGHRHGAVLAAASTYARRLFQYLDKHRARVAEIRVSRAAPALTGLAPTTGMRGRCTGSCG
jgi:hypothetical protein